MPLNDLARALLDAPNIGVISTLEPDGRPQQSPVWVKRDGDDVLFSTADGRRKPANLRRDPRIGVLVVDRDDPASYVEVRGTAVIEDDPEKQLIDELSRKYDGEPWAEDPAVRRLIVRITPDHVVTR